MAEDVAGQVRGRLVLFNLGSYVLHLFHRLSLASPAHNGGAFLSRRKADARLVIVEMHGNRRGRVSPWSVL